MAFSGTRELYSQYLDSNLYDENEPFLQSVQLHMMSLACFEGHFQ